MESFYSLRMHFAGVQGRRRRVHAGGGAGGDDGQLRGWGEGSRGRWRKPLRILVHGKGLEGASLERRSGEAAVGCGNWCILGTSSQPCLVLACC